jgi:hypothetical protein
MPSSQNGAFVFNCERIKWNLFVVSDYSRKCNLHFFIENRGKQTLATLSIIVRFPNVKNSAEKLSYFRCLCIVLVSRAKP